MNKIKATKKEMRQNYRIISIGYCDAQHLLNYKSPFAYTCGANGWTADYYDIDGVLISTGYDPIASKNAKVDYKTLREYEKKAQEVNTAEEVNALLKQFISECIA
jgi:hypothetical protein